MRSVAISGLDFRRAAESDGRVGALMPAKIAGTTSIAVARKAALPGVAEIERVRQGVWPDGRSLKREDSFLAEPLAHRSGARLLDPAGRARATGRAFHPRHSLASSNDALATGQQRLGAYLQKDLA